ncbi:hypothetical protein [Oceanobacillus chungangensis]|uniref:hypothetical protein n=1 Tax=Oceanobacillus chungangensis TaxID=1229152 RepID=UPI0014731753|nr:hypothetical protein [Oceanobacillus chungangensis]
MKNGLIAIGVGSLIIVNSALGFTVNNDNEIRNTIESYINIDVQVIPNSDEQPRSN